jgi:hypothetical protein
MGHLYKLHRSNTTAKTSELVNCLLAHASNQPKSLIMTFPTFRYQSIIKVNWTETEVGTSNISSLILRQLNIASAMSSRLSGRLANLKDTTKRTFRRPRRRFEGAEGKKSHVQYCCASWYHPCTQSPRNL